MKRLVISYTSECMYINNSKVLGSLDSVQMKSAIAPDVDHSRDLPGTEYNDSLFIYSFAL